MKELRSFRHDQILARCRWSPDGASVAAGGFDGVVRLWTVETGEAVVVARHPSWISGIAFSDAGRVLSSDLQGGLACSSGWSVDAGPTDSMRAFAASGGLAATGGRDGVVRLWSASDGKLVRELRGHGAPLFSATFSPAGLLATGDAAGAIRLWEPATGALVREIKVPELVTREPDFLCDVGGIRALAFDATGARLAAAGLAEAKSNTFCPGKPRAVVVEASTGKVLSTARLKDEKIDGPFTAVRFLADGTLVASGEGQSSGVIGLWKSGEAEPFHVASGQSVYDVDVRPDGRAVAVAVFDPIGQGGNGRGSKRGEYVPNGARLKILDPGQK